MKYILLCHGDEQGWNKLSETEMKQILGEYMQFMQQIKSRGQYLSEVRIDDTVVMIADGGEGWPPAPSYVHIYVADVDATYKRALEAGASSVQEPVKKEDEDKRGGVKDAGGTTWWIATKVE